MKEFPASFGPSSGAKQRTAVIIGAGPAGLTAALELLQRSDIRPVILEASDTIGGLSRTVNYKGNRMDIGGHRFFSKSDRVMDWWLKQMPLDPAANTGQSIAYHGKQRPLPQRGTDPAKNAPEGCMLVRDRKSRIYFLRRFFSYPIALNGETVRNLGARRTARIGASYLKARLRPIRKERNLQDFLINRFGRQLYLTFFKSYTEKVWGLSCDTISAEWGAQRIKRLSLTSTLKHVARKRFGRPDRGLAQKKTETSLIERFLYPALGPGQLWENVARQVVELGGKIHKGATVDRLYIEGNRVRAVEAIVASGERLHLSADFAFSTMPVRDLIRAMGPNVPDSVREVSEGLLYRDFLTVGILADRLALTEPDGGLLKDNWIYIQEPDVLMGRLQIFNNWSPYMVADPSKVWIGLEYFCYETDPLWKMPDEDLKHFAAKELQKIGILPASQVLDSHIVRVPKTYPAYFGTYDRFDELRRYTDRFENLFLIGRNGMHRYNNQDHSMLTAMTAVDNILSGKLDKSSLWQINTEQDYHEEK